MRRSLKYIHQDEIERFEKLAERFPALPQLLGQQDWTQFTDPSTPREAVHPLFWILQNPHRGERFMLALRMLERGGRLPASIVRNLLDDKANSPSLIREIEIYYLITSKGIPVDWKPRLHGPNGPLPRNPDLKIIRKPKSILLEIVCINEQQEALLHTEAEVRLRRMLEDLPGNPYLISFSYRRHLTPADVQAAFSFISSFVKKLKSMGAEQGDEDYVESEISVMRVELKIAEDGNGRWIASTGPVMVGGAGGRIKAKIADKLKRYQFPEGSVYINGFVVVLEDLFMDTEDLVEAVIGQSQFVMSLGSKGGAIRETRAFNGIIHDPETEKILAEGIDFIVGLLWREVGNPMPDVKALRNDERCPLTEEEIRGLFLC